MTSVDFTCILDIELEVAACVSLVEKEPRRSEIVEEDGSLHANNFTLQQKGRESKIENWGVIADADIFWTLKGRYFSETNAFRG